MGAAKTIFDRRKGDKYHIAAITKPDGSCPAEEFLESLGDKVTAHILAWLNYLRENGSIPNPKKFKKLIDTGGLWEIKHEGTKARILCFFCGDVLVLTHGFIKKSRRAPKPEIKRAERIKRDYEEGI